MCRDIRKWVDQKSVTSICGKNWFCARSVFFRHPACSSVHSCSCAQADVHVGGPSRASTPGNSCWSVQSRVVFLLDTHVLVVLGAFHSHLEEMVERRVRLKQALPVFCFCEFTNRFSEIHCLVLFNRSCWIQPHDATMAVTYIQCEWCLQMRLEEFFPSSVLDSVAWHTQHPGEAPRKRPWTCKPCRAQDWQVRKSIEAMARIRLPGDEVLAT